MRFEVAHGQLDEKDLEARMMTFLRGEADVLVATSIIESGIDIPQANTLIVERADVFGLAQLYQIRGAGNLLGDEQSGHVAALGFELYLSMLEEAVLAGSGDGAVDEPEPVRLDVNVDAYVPADYIPYEQAKIDVHRRIAASRDVGELA